MGNLFAFRSATPSRLYRVEDPIGRQNDEWICKLQKEAKKIVLGWCNHACYLNRGQDVVRFDRPIFLFSDNKRKTTWSSTVSFR
jgi:hypothetical protein